MEKLKYMVPGSLRQMVADSTPHDLPSTSSSLLDFFLNLSEFRQMVKDLADPETSLCAKNKGVALESKQKGNKCYQGGDYTTALACYSQALRVAPIDAIDMDKNLVATLYLNRASLFYKIGLHTECLRDCNRALQTFPSYAKAWYRRGKVNATLGNHKDAIQDLNVAKNMESSLSGKGQIESELKIILDQYNHKGIASTPVQHIKKLENFDCVIDEPQQIKLLRIDTPNKGRGMASQYDIPQASLVHKEKPFALIVSKSCRETHCHYCLNELPVDIVPCISCSMPLYCSRHCQMQAGGETSNDHLKNDGVDESHSENIENYISRITLSSDSDSNTGCSAEHKHECLGVHWPAVLPSDIVLAGRALVKSMSMSQRSSLDSDLWGTLDLCHHYSQTSSEGKLELHIYAAVLLCCLQHSKGFELPLNGASLSQIVILISQIRVNAMAIVRMKSADANCLLDQFGKSSSIGDALTSSVDQVPVGQAIYTAGSLFNHSCQPNVHAYFLSRTLFVQTTEFVKAGDHQELSYGPQVGQWDYKDRNKFLEDKYSFQCRCSSCSELNLSDLVLNAFCCVNQSCPGVVLDTSVITCENDRLKYFCRAPNKHSLDPYVQVDKINDANIRPGYCLKCGSSRNLEASYEAMNEACGYIKGLQNAIISEELSGTLLSDASRALGVLRSILHAYNKKIAEAEDNLARAFCLVGDLQSARDHCKASIKILEKLYGPDHIAIGYELVKLATIQLFLDNESAVDSMDRLDRIFQRYHGLHVDAIFPYLKSLREQAYNQQTSLLVSSIEG